MFGKNKIFKITSVAILLASSLLANSIENNQKAPETHTADNTHDSNKSHGSHWGYEGENGPVNWGHIKSGHAICKHGERQSPINIIPSTTLKENELNSILFDYTNAKINILNNGHTIQVNSDNTSYASFQGKKFKLLQYHFHSQSEHTVDGKYYPLEVHLVHQAEDGELAVIGVFFEVGKTNETMEKILASMPKTQETIHKDDLELNANNLLPRNRNYYHYLGSLTTPPCTEIVEWYVMKEPIEISEEQLKTFQALYSGNYRPVCDLGSRKVLEK